VTAARGGFGGAVALGVALTAAALVLTAGAIPITGPAVPGTGVAIVAVALAVAAALSGPVVDRPATITSTGIAAPTATVAAISRQVRGQAFGLPSAGAASASPRRAWKLSRKSGGVGRSRLARASSVSCRRFRGSAWRSRLVMLGVSLRGIFSSTSRLME
jgi:hypothetical protein